MRAEDLQRALVLAHRVIDGTSEPGLPEELARIVLMFRTCRDRDDEPDRRFCKYCALGCPSTDCVHQRYGILPFEPGGL